MTEAIRPGDPDPTTPAVIVSCDAHVGPRLKEQLRPYCPTEYLERFDEQVAAHEQEQAAMRAADPASEAGRRAALFASHPNMKTAGHHDAGVRLREMDQDGVAAELFWHFSQNGEPMPFAGHGLMTVPPDNFELATVGFHLYNRWLADFCSADPERLLGLVYLPMWDVDAAVKELRWAREAGLRVVNFPPPSRPGVLEYNNRSWDPFWSACEDLGMALATHSSGGPMFDYDTGPGANPLRVYEGGGWLARRAVWWLIYGEVFERHPELKLVITEQYEGWWLPTLLELDSVYMTFGTFDGKRMPRLPSDYARSNVFLGASFMSTFLAEEAWREGYADNVLWGRDYPHVEGIWRPLTDPNAEPVTKVALRYVLSRVPSREALKMAGRNAVRVYGLDGEYLAQVAAGIGAPTAGELAVPPTSLPYVDRSNAFLGQAGPRPLEPERIARSTLMPAAG
jgi:predicted TIM-barrel fold metal-dependent hydrolase